MVTLGASSLRNPQMVNEPNRSLLRSVEKKSVWLMAKSETADPQDHQCCLDTLLSLRPPPLSLVDTLWRNGESETFTFLRQKVGIPVNLTRKVASLNDKLGCFRNSIWHIHFGPIGSTATTPVQQPPWDLLQSSATTRTGVLSHRWITRKVHFLLAACGSIPWKAQPTGPNLPSFYQRHLDINWWDRALTESRRFVVW